MTFLFHKEITFVLSWPKKLDINYSTENVSGILHFLLCIGALNLHLFHVGKDEQKWDYVMEQGDGEWARDTVRPPSGRRLVGELGEVRGVWRQEGGVGTRRRMRGRCVCTNGSCRSLLKAAPHWPATVPRVKEVSPGKLGLAASVHVFHFAKGYF